MEHVDLSGELSFPKPFPLQRRLTGDLKGCSDLAFQGQLGVQRSQESPRRTYSTQSVFPLNSKLQ